MLQAWTQVYEGVTLPQHSPPSLVITHHLGRDWNSRSPSILHCFRKKKKIFQSTSSAPSYSEEAPSKLSSEVTPKAVTAPTLLFYHSEPSMVCLMLTCNKEQTLAWATSTSRTSWCHSPDKPQLSTKPPTLQQKVFGSPWTAVLTGVRATLCVPYHMATISVVSQRVTFSVPGHQRVWPRPQTALVWFLASGWYKGIFFYLRSFYEWVLSVV